MWITRFCIDSSCSACDRVIIIAPDWGEIFENRANYCGVKMQKLSGRNPRYLELLQEIQSFAGFGGDDHDFYGSTSCCISQWPSQWEWANFDHTQLGNHLTDHDEIRTLEMSPEDHPPCKISFRSDNVGGLGEHPVCHCQVSFFVFFIFGFFVTCTGRNGGPILTIGLCTSYDVFSPKDVPFGGFVDMPPHFI